MEVFDLLAVAADRAFGRCEGARASGIGRRRRQQGDPTASFRRFPQPGLSDACASIQFGSIRRVGQDHSATGLCVAAIVTARAWFSTCADNGLTKSGIRRLGDDRESLNGA